MVVVVIFRFISQNIYDRFFYLFSIINHILFQIDAISTFSSNKRNCQTIKINKLFMSITICICHLKPCCEMTKSHKQWEQIENTKHIGIIGCDHDYFTVLQIVCISHIECRECIHSHTHTHFHRMQPHPLQCMSSRQLPFMWFLAKWFFLSLHMHAPHNILHRIRFVVLSTHWNSFHFPSHFFNWIKF